MVLRVDSDPKLGSIVHIEVNGLRIPNPYRGGYVEKIGHMPFAEEWITKSATKLLKENIELPDFEEGYKQWREAFDAKRAGVYTISIAEAVEVAEKTFRQ